MPTSNDYAWACQATCRLLARHWPAHPPVDVAHFEVRPALPQDGRFAPLDFGRQADCKKWIEQFIRYLASENGDQLVLLCLDDYGLCRAVNEAAVETGCEVLRSDPQIASFALTWQPTRKAPYRESRDVVTFPAWAYAVNLQAGIWRRAELLRILRRVAAACGPWDFEIEASRWFNARRFPAGYRMAGWNCPEPPNPSGFVDSVDKSGWPFAYHNLVRRKQRDARHDAFLKMEGLL